MAIFKLVYDTDQVLSWSSDLWALDALSVTR